MWAFHCSGFSCCSSWALEFGLNSCGAWAWMLLGMWDLPRPGIKSMSPALAGGFFTTEPPGKPHKNSWSPFSSAQIHITGLFNLGSQEMYRAQESDPTCYCFGLCCFSAAPGLCSYSGYSKHFFCSFLPSLRSQSGCTHAGDTLSWSLSIHDFLASNSHAIHGM